MDLDNTSKNKMTGDDHRRPIRILHIVGGMNTGGVETWLMNVLRKIDREQYKFDFLVHTDQPCFYDEEIKSLGSRIFPCPHPQDLWQYSRNFHRILKKNGPYDVVHSHVHHFSGFTLFLASLAGVPARIAHSHSDTILNEKRTGIRRHLYLRVAECLIGRCATIGLACSRFAANSLFGKNWKSDPRWQILYCGIDLLPFMHPANRPEVRRELGIPHDTFVIGHVGRFSEAKNHDFLLDIFNEVVRQEPNSRLLLVGDGPLREKIRQKAERLDLTDKIIFAGVRPDIPRLMLGAMDVFVFPSLHEGLPLALVEAQAAQLSCIFSENITKEAIILPNLIHRVSLRKASSHWSDVIINVEEDTTIHQDRASDIVCQSQFNIDIATRQLTALYSNPPEPKHKYNRK